MARIAVIGAGINGVMSAWALRKAGHEVVLFERASPMQATSQASTKLLHGGLRYLETGDWRLVYEALAERAWWLQQAPHLTRQLKLLLPIYKGRARPRLMIRLGLSLYDRLAPRGWPKHRWWPAAKVIAAMPALERNNLLGAFEFTDGQMDDLALGLWALQQASASGVVVRQSCAVHKISVLGQVHGDSFEEAFDLVCNLAGPWAEQLLNQSAMQGKVGLRLVRGSHLLLKGSLDIGLLLQAPQDNRVFFALPGFGRHTGLTVLGTTEAPHQLGDPIAASAAEQQYLEQAYLAYFPQANMAGLVVGSFAGVRPLVQQGASANVNTREHLMQVNGRCLTVLGGKWTTARALGEEVALQADKLIRQGV
jgi:glycerol-3-phosphate dehydrogenase